jgi:hypothetical protein
MQIHLGPYAQHYILVFRFEPMDGGAPIDCLAETHTAAHSPYGITNTNPSQNLSSSFLFVVLQQVLAIFLFR